MELILIKDLKTFADYERDIDELLKRSSTKDLFTTYDYVYVWLSLFGQDNFTILLLKKDNVVVGLLSLIKSRYSKLFPVSIYKIAGEGLRDYGDFLVDDRFRDEVVVSFLDHILRNIDFGRIEIGPVPLDSPTMPILKRYLSHHEKSFEIDITADAPFIRPSGSFEEYAIQGLRRNSTMPDVLRCLRRLSEIGQVRYMKIIDKNTCTREELMRYMEVFLEMYQRQWKINRFQKEGRYIEFYKEFAYRSLVKGYFELSLLYIDDKIIAMHYGFHLNNRRYYFTPTYDIAYKQYSPGKILLYNLIKDSFEYSEEFDFLHGREAYKFEWTEQVQKQAMIYIYGNTVFKKLVSVRRFGIRIRTDIKKLVTKFFG